MVRRKARISTVSLNQRARASLAHLTTLGGAPDPRRRDSTATSEPLPQVERVKTMMNELHVALDSQCMSYLIDAMEGVKEPVCNVADQKKALIRIWLYTPVLFHVTATVRTECAQIQDEKRRALHEDYAITLLWDPPVFQPDLVARRVVELLPSHPSELDCRVLAEAEEHSFDALLTFDHDFWTRLGPKAPVVPLQQPIQFWKGLSISRGARPTRLPHRTNPLSRETWWRW